MTEESKCCSQVQNLTNPGTTAQSSNESGLLFNCGMSRRIPYVIYSLQSFVVKGLRRVLAIFLLIFHEYLSNTQTISNIPCGKEKLTS